MENKNENLEETSSKCWEYVVRAYEALVKNKDQTPQRLLHLPDCAAIIRKDYGDLNRKVKIFGGGSIFQGITFTNFVGHNMLTAVILGLHTDSSLTPTSDMILEAVKLTIVEKSDANGVLIILDESTDYLQQFYETKSKAEVEGIPIKIIIHKKRKSSNLGLVFLYKLAGAMAEDMKTLNEIYYECEKCMHSEIFLSDSMNVLHSDIQSKNLQVEDVANLIVKRISDHINNYLTNTEDLINPVGCTKIVIVLDYSYEYYGCINQDFIQNLQNQLCQFQIEIKLLRKTKLFNCLNLIDFHFALFNIMDSSKILNYLERPIISGLWEEPAQFTQNEINANAEIESLFAAKLLLIAIKFACEALIACSKNIDLLDKSSHYQEKCGSRLSSTAKMIKEDVQGNNFLRLDPSQIMYYLAIRFYGSIQDPQAKLYGLFFQSIAEILENSNNPDYSVWKTALDNSINKIGTLIPGTKFYDTLVIARDAIYDYNNKKTESNLISLLEKVAYAIQSQTTKFDAHTPSELNELAKESDYNFLGYAAIHAIGIWLRGAYEGIKYKYASFAAETSRHTQDHLYSDSDEDMQVVQILD